MNQINKLATRVIFMLVFAIYFLVFAILIKNELFIKEGFNTYFRQTVRPHIRNAKDTRENITYHFNTKFKDFGRSLGFY
jgi:hypothetical protein